MRKESYLNGLTESVRQGNEKAMRRTNWIAGVLVIGAMLLILLNSCSLSKSLFGEEEEKSASELMSEGLRSFDRGYFKSAGEAFQKVKDRYPYSKYALQAELKMADAFYELEEYEQAYNAYDEFEKLHPKNKSIPYVIYRKGMCHFQKIRSVDREQVHTFKAKEEFERVIARFPRDEHANMARKNVRMCLIFLAEYELYVGRFYYKKGEYRAALGRFIYVLQNYPDTGQYNEAIEYISRCKEKLAQQEPEQAEG